MHQPQAPNGDPIIAARFAPPVLPRTFVHRERLTRRLTDGVTGPIVLISGPAGAGKTLLAAEWFTRARPPGPAAWLTVEPSDDAPGVFWAYVLQALRHHGVDLPDDLGAPADARQVDPSLLARLAAHLHDRTPPVVLVLDEFERTSSPEVAAGLHDLLRHGSPGLRLVLVSRSEPLLPLHRYRLAGELTSIRAADLAFDEAEAAALFARHGLAPSEGTLRGLVERTGGWAAGLRLSALAAREAPDPAACLHGFEAARETIADFLTVEVLQTQPPETQDLLLRTCVLDQVHPGLADALTGRRDAAPILDGLSRANAFVSPIGGSWYRYHPLFAEILRVHLRGRHPGLEPELRRRAAHWLAGAGRTGEAVRQAAGAGQWESAAALLVDQLMIGLLLTGRDTELFRGLFAAMPPDVPGPAPELVRAALALGRREGGPALRHLHRAGELLAAGGTAPRWSQACLEVLAARLLGSAAAARRAAERAAELGGQLPAELRDRHPELPALLLADLGAVLLWDGRLDEASAALSAAAEAAGGPAAAQVRHESLSRLGLIDALDGRLGRAEARAGSAEDEAEHAGLPPTAMTGAGRLVLAEVALDRGDLPGARAALQRAERTAYRQDPLVVQELAVTRSRLTLAEGDPRGALAALQEAEKAGPAAAAPSPWLGDRVAAAASTAQLAAGRPEAALAALADTGATGPDAAVAAAAAQVALGRPRQALRILADVPPTASRGAVVEVPVLLARAQASACLGDEPAARRALARALAAARPERLRLPFRLSGPWLPRLLRAYPALAAGHPWLPPDLRAAAHQRPADGSGAAAQPVEPLSGREREVLSRAALLLSTDEIAADLHLSVNTVKTHLKSINRKLSATRRGEAVRRARALHLL